MAFRTGTNLSQHYRNAKDAASRIKNMLSVARNQMSVAPYDAQNVISLFININSVLTIWTTVAAQPEIVAEAQTQEQDPAYDVAAEFTAMRNALLDVRDFIHSAFPKDVDGWWLFISYDSTGAQTVRQFTVPQLAGLVTRIDTFLATVT